MFGIGLLVCLVSGAHSDTLNGVYCNGSGNYGTGLSIVFVVIADDLSSVETQQAAQSTLNTKVKEAWQKCVQAGRAPSRFVALVQVMVPGVGIRDVATAILPFGQTVWALNYNAYFEQTKTQINNAKAETAKKNQEIATAKDSSLKMQADFKAQTGLVMWVNAQVLKANPFPYQGKIVGLMTTFQQMTGSGVAMFGGNFDVVATGVPNTMFTRPGAPIFLAVQVNGVKPVKVLGMDMSAVDGTYKGVYFCKTQNCGEFVGPH
jgi:hypothetical protein